MNLPTVDFAISYYSEQSNTLHYCRHILADNEYPSTYAAGDKLLNNDHMIMTDDTAMTHDTQ